MASVSRIGLLGGEATGKTTLALALADELGACVVGEQLRAFVDHHGRPPRVDEQSGLLAAQQRAEDAAADACPTDLLIADPAPLMTAVYSVAYYDDRSLLDVALTGAARYALIGWCRPDLPWTPDGAQRDGPHRRAQVDALVADLVRDELVPRGVTVLDLTGSPEMRTQAVRLAWLRRAHRGPT